MLMLFWIGCVALLNVHAINYESAHVTMSYRESEEELKCCNREKKTQLNISVIREAIKN